MLKISIQFFTFEKNLCFLSSVIISKYCRNRLNAIVITEIYKCSIGIQDHRVFGFFRLVGEGREI